MSSLIIQCFTIAKYFLSKYWVTDENVVELKVCVFGSFLMAIVHGEKMCPKQIIKANAILNFTQKVKPNEDHSPSEGSRHPVTFANGLLNPYTLHVCLIDTK